MLHLHVTVARRLTDIVCKALATRYLFLNPGLLLGGELLAERCRIDDLMPSIPVLCLPPSCVDPKVLGPNVLVYHSQVDLGRPGGLRQSGGGRSAAAMTRWWSYSGADRARCPKNLNRNDLTFSEAGKKPVMLLTVSFVMCLLYGIRGTGCQRNVGSCHMQHFRY